MNSGVNPFHFLKCTPPGIIIVHYFMNLPYFTLSWSGFLFSQKKVLTCKSLKIFKGSSWPWSYGSWIHNYLHLCNQCLSPLTLWVRISPIARCTTLCDKVCQWLVTGRWFSPRTPVSSINKTCRHDITEILLKVALNTIKQTEKLYNIGVSSTPHHQRKSL